MTIYNLNIQNIALEWQKKHGGAVLATVVSTWELAPRPVGSQFFISKSGWASTMKPEDISIKSRLFYGKSSEIIDSVTGGCMEEDLFKMAIEVVDSGLPKLLEFDAISSLASKKGLDCSAEIKILLEPVGTEFGISEELLLNLKNACTKFKNARAKLWPIALCVNLKSWERMLVRDEHSPLGSLVTDRLIADSPGMEGDWFISVYNPCLHMYVVGGGRTALRLVDVAELAGYLGFVVDPRMTHPTENCLSKYCYLPMWPYEVIPELHTKNFRNAIVVLSQDEEIDANALKLSLTTDAFYIGYLGSQETYDRHCQQLIKNGATEAQVARIQTPAGIKIGASTPTEIAIAIMGQVTESLRKPKVKIDTSVE